MNCFFRGLIVFFISVISNSAFAFFCPGNFSTINPGDTIDRVVQLCGQPTSQQQLFSTPNPPQEWNYYKQLNPTDQGTMKVSVAFEKGRVVNISMNGLGISGTQICGTAIYTGDTMKTVETACGKPSFINKTEDIFNGPVGEKRINILIYNGPPKVSLTFENGRLVSREQM